MKYNEILIILSAVIIWILFLYVIDNVASISTTPLLRTSVGEWNALI